jgi:putative pyruvate formate lyase activating enzyme
MLKLQGKGCHNINLVSPTHVIPQILEALLIAVPKGLKIPLVYNTGGYESAEMVKLLEGIVDIYLPDMRYADHALSKQYSCAPDYPKYNRAAVKEMHRQAGVASINEQGIMEKGVIVRHLVLPENISGTDNIMKFLAEEISAETFISLMSQYTPYYKALGTPRINRRITVEEYEKAQDIMEACGLANGWIQDAGGLEHFAGIHIKPMFNKDE